jgi:hypothetical protein
MGDQRRSARPTSALGGQHGYVVVFPLLILLLPLLGAAQRRGVQSDGVFYLLEKSHQCSGGYLRNQRDDYIGTNQ